VRWLKLMRTTRYSLPNILAGRDLVPELMQDACTPAALAQAVLDLFRAPDQRAALVQEFERIHEALRGPGDASNAAAAAVAELTASAQPQGFDAH
jgi:lipid-A-disaccharide synthase